MSHTILVTGGSGQLGTELKRLALPEGWAIAAPDLDEFDLTDLARAEAFVRAGGYRAVINGAAYTAVDKAEQEQVEAWRINALAPATLAAACRDLAIPIVQVSTDYVFPGDRPGAWTPDDPIAPLNVYGASKAGGELAVRASGARYAIVRTAWVVSAHGANFVKTMLRIGAERDTLKVVADQHGAPTMASDLASALATIAIALADDPSRPSGTWHFSNAGATSWHGFAVAIFEAAARRGMRAPAVEAIASSAFPTPAARPANSLLSCESVTRDFGIVPRSWRIGLEEVLDELLQDEDQ